jgi:tetratricopeptide (TPR) repeat protein
LFMGLSTINRPNVLIFIPFIAVWILWMERKRIGFGFARAIAWCVACAIPILPVTIRNIVEGDDFVLIASQAGPNFYIGNNPQSDGYTANLPGSRSTWAGGFNDWISMAEQETGRKMKASEVDKFFFDKSWEFIRTQKRHALNLTLIKAQLFFYEWEIPNDSDPISMAGIYAPWMSKMPVTSGAILALGLIGFAISVFDFKRLLPLTGFVVLYSASVIAFFVCSRFRVPMMPVAIVLAAVVPVKLFILAREQEWRTIFGICIFTYLAWVSVNRGLDQKRLNQYAAVSHQRIGQKLGEKSLPGEEEHYKIALQLDPNCEEAESGFAFFYLRNHKPNDAIRHFQKALEINGELDLHATLAALLAQQGRWEEAINTIRSGLIHLPGYLDLKRKLAYMLATCPVDPLRDGKEAVRLAEEAASVGGEFPETYDTLAVAYAEDGRFDDAIKAAEKAIDIAEKQANIPAVLMIREHLKLFREHKPYRQDVGVVWPQQPKDALPPRSSP